MPAITAKECAKMIIESDNIVAMSGAGISTAAGIPDFRGPNGLYVTRRYDPETVFDINYYLRHPKSFYDFSRDLLSVVDTLQPTFTHYFLTELEKAGKLKSLITQNIDPLHQIAGTEKIISVHGNYSSSRCLDCAKVFGYDEFVDLLNAHEIPLCHCGGLIKPDVVFFGEAVIGMREAEELASTCDLMLVLGSSLNVYPAAILPQIAQKVVIVNKGQVGIKDQPSRYFVNSDLDRFFTEIAAELDIVVKST